MKACSDRCPALSLLAAEALPPAEAEALRHHLTSCPGCRMHFAELVAVVADHRRVATDGPGPELSVAVQRRVATAIRHDARHRRAGSPLSPVLPWLGWIGVTAAAVAVTALAIVWLRGREVPASGPIVGIRRVAPSVATNPVPGTSILAEVGGDEPDFGAFRLALNRSEAEFERRLAGGRSGGSGPAELRFRPGGAGAGFDASEP